MFLCSHFPPCPLFVLFYVILLFIGASDISFSSTFTLTNFLMKTTSRVSYTKNFLQFCRCILYFRLYRGRSQWFRKKKLLNGGGGVFNVSLKGCKNPSLWILIYTSHLLSKYYQIWNLSIFIDELMTKFRILTFFRPRKAFSSPEIGECTSNQTPPSSRHFNDFLTSKHILLILAELR